jgi:hypothetical protein
MRSLMKILSLLALILTIAPAIMLVNGSLTLDQVKLFMLVATVVWYIATPFWMGRKC